MDKAPLTPIEVSSRSFVEDGDSVALRVAARGDGFRIGFGECTGLVLPSLNAMTTRFSAALIEHAAQPLQYGPTLHFRRPYSLS